MAYYLSLPGTSNNYVSVPSNAAFNLVNNFNISITFAPSDLNSTNKYLLRRANGSDDDCYSIIWEYVNNKVEFYTFSFTGTNPRSVSGIVIPDTNKHTVVYEYDGTTFKGYLDGVQQFSTSIAFSLGAQTSTLFIGAAALNVANFAGSLYDVSIYKNSVLSGQWTFNVGSGTTILDGSGNGNTATITGGTWVSDATGTDVSISSVVATATNNGVTPNVSVQVSKTISSVTATASNQALSPSVGSSNAVSITSAVAAVALSGISPSVSTGVNISSTLSNAVASAMTPFIGSLAITVNSVAASASSQFVPPNVTIAYEIISVVNLEGIKTFIVPLQGSKEQTVQVLGLKDNIVLLEGEI